MQSALAATLISPRMLWLSRILSALPVVMLLFSAVMKFGKTRAPGLIRNSRGWAIRRT